MKRDFSASTSGKTGTVGAGTSPFEQITTLEQHEAKRVQQELDAMAAEEREVTQSLREKEEQSDREIREQTKKELVEYREKELAAIIKNAEKESARMTTELESTFTQKESSLVEDLVSAFLSYSSR